MEIKCAPHIDRIKIISIMKKYDEMNEFFFILTKDLNFKF